MIDISCSIVLFHNPVNDIKNAINSFLNTTSNVKLFLVDNSSDDSFRYVFDNYSPLVEYIYNGRNLGYGSAHNIAIEKALGLSKYHLVLNPDVVFNSTVIERLGWVMENNPDIGLVMPKILYPNGSIQYLCKILPSPAHLFLRRFIPGPFKGLFKKTLEKYELRNRDYNAVMETPNLSGCFMFIRTSVFREVGMFDERFFLYMEDTDLCRRISKQYRTIYYPVVSIIHGYGKASYKNWNILKLHLKSSIKYFNKWGWFNDKDRLALNSIAFKSTVNFKGTLKGITRVTNIVNAGGSLESTESSLSSIQPHINLN